jgi:2',3'-cyclic-nucleotide 2'-phosphodiesterase (5'-nucleotidase family)/predicted extracellular nuclease
MKTNREDYFMRKKVLSFLVLSAFLLSSLIPGPVQAQASPVTIMEIQGSGQYSPYDGQVVQTSGVVTLFTANGFHCWIQDPVGDNDPSTSDGVFVSGCGAPAAGEPPQVGDFIQIVAGVQEQQFGNALPLTRLRNVESITIQSSGNRLPRPVVINMLPNLSVAEAIEFWEPLEGMLVSISNAPVVAPTNAFGEFVVLARRNAVPNSGYYPQENHILLRSLGDNEVDYNPERIMIDDSSLNSPIIVKPGDRVRSLTGVVDYTFGNYKIQPATYNVQAHRLPNLPVSKRSGPPGDVVITSFNVQNLFDLVINPDKDDASSTPTPEQLEVQLTKLARAIEIELRLPDILVVQEVENTAILQVLGDRVNAATGTSYVATSFEVSDVRGIEVGFLWDSGRVALLDAFQLSGPDVEAAFGPSSPSPGREPIVGMFSLTGNLLDPPVYIIGNHFKSKSGDDPIFGVNWPPVRMTEVQRHMQAQVVRDFVNELFEQDPNALVMVTGDLNDFQFGEPGEGSNHTVGIIEGTGDEIPLINLINFVRDPQRYTYVFDGNSQVLDHMLVSPMLYELFAAVDVLHFNAGYPAVLARDLSTTLRASDHDAVEGRFNLPPMFGRIDFMLTLLHNNDGESRLLYAADTEELRDFGNVARFATVVDNLRAEALDGPGSRAVLMLSSGDNFLAGPEFNASLARIPDEEPFYDTIAMRLIGYDASAIGNHEFDFGPDVLAYFIEGFEGTVPFVSANLDFTGEPRLQMLVDQNVIVKSFSLERAGEWIGIVGATTPRLPTISSPRNVVVDPNIAAAVQMEIDYLLASGVNKIIMISHLQSILEDLELAPMLSGIDIMIAGGGDELLANPGDLLVPGDTVYGPYPLFATDAEGIAVPVITTPGNYKYVGRLIAGFSAAGDLVYIGPESGPVRVAGGSYPDAVEPDPEVQALVVEPVAAYVEDLATTVIGTSEVALEGRRPEIRTRETNLGNLTADSLFWQASQLADTFGVNPPDVAFQNGGGIRNDSLIPAGPITQLTTFSILPFANFVSIVPDVPRDQFKEIMENAVSRIEFVDGRFAQISGFRFVYDITGQAQVLDLEGNVTTPGSRVVEIQLDDGTFIVQNGAVVPGDPINVATIDFLANGGDQYPFRGAPFTTLGVTYQLALENFIIQGLGGLISAQDYPEGGEGRTTAQ